MSGPYPSPTTLAPARGHRVLCCPATYHDDYDDAERRTVRAWIEAEGVNFNDVASICSDDEHGDHLIVYRTDTDGRRYLDRATDRADVRRVDAEQPFPLAAPARWLNPDGVQEGRDEQGRTVL